MIADEFRARFGTDPQLVIRAPGRVNLIGEHIDYAGLPVMPMAIDREIRLAVAPGGGRWESLAMGDEDGWKAYPAAAAAESGLVADVDLLVGGDLPSMGGLSSSSALVVAALLAFDGLAGHSRPRADVIERAVRAERSLGVEGGTMDQTVIATASPGAALRIDFLPIRARPIRLPEGLSVVVGHSGQAAAKATEARHDYNLRVVTARAVASLVAHQHGVDAGNPPSLGRLRDVPGPSWFPEAATARAVAAATHIDVASLVTLTTGVFDPDTPLPIQPGADHLQSEARRVDAMEAALRAGDLVQAGRILDASHESLRGFGASSTRLDELTSSMRQAGALGARLTGAGFGGFAMAFCAEPQVAAVLEAATAATGGPAFEVHPAAQAGPL